VSNSKNERLKVKKTKSKRKRIENPWKKTRKYCFV